jgi:hypothetical protein
LVFLALLGLCRLSAQGFVMNEIFQRQANDWVLYWDTRGGREAFFGMEYRGDTTYILRSYDLASRAESVIQLSYVNQADRMVSRDLKVLKGPDDPAAYQAMLLDFFLIVNNDDRLDRGAFPADIPYRATVGPEGKSVTKDFLYKFWVPVFGLYSITEEGAASPGLRLVDCGRSGKSEARRFYDTRSRPTIVDGPTYTIPSAETKHLTYDLVELAFDTNWKVEGNVANLAVRTPRDAQLAFANYRVDKATKPAREIALTLAFAKLVTMGVPMITDSVRLQAAEGKVVLEYYVINPSDHMASRVVDIYRYASDGRFDNVTLYSYATLYADNQAYFDAIVQDVLDD